jgi:hypothetical protein
MTEHRNGTIAAFVMLTIDGFYEGPDGAFDFWKLDRRLRTVLEPAAR